MPGIGLPIIKNLPTGRNVGIFHPGIIYNQCTGCYSMSEMWQCLDKIFIVIPHFCDITIVLCLLFKNQYII